VLFRSSYFTCRIHAWIEAVDPVAAYVILDAIPGQLTRKPAGVRDVLKYLYGKICVKAYSTTTDISETMISKDDNVGDMGELSYGFSANIFGKLSTVHNPNDNYRRLGMILSGAPKLLRMSKDQIRKQEQQLESIFETLISITGNQKSMPLLSAPRLITEPVHRLAFRKQILTEFMAAGYIVGGGSNATNNSMHQVSNVSKLMLLHPNLLVSPISTLFRIPFTSVERTTALSTADCEWMTICNTQQFIERLSGFLPDKYYDAAAGIRAYSSYLETISSKLAHNLIFHGATSSENNQDTGSAIAQDGVPYEMVEESNVSSNRFEARDKENAEAVSYTYSDVRLQEGSLCNSLNMLSEQNCAWDNAVFQILSAT